MAGRDLTLIITYDDRKVDQEYVVANIEEITGVKRVVRLFEATTSN